MNQLKLLNFHKMLANFANNLVGAFIPLIIYQATGNLIYSISYCVGYNTFRLMITLIIRPLYNKYPQLLLLIRIIPITIGNLFIFVIDKNLLLGVIGVTLFLSTDSAINNLSKEIIFNYSSLTKKDSDNSIGITRLFEQIGIIVALVTGGFLLDFNKTIVLVLSLSIYATSVIPLVMYYIKSKNQKTFNKDATSNAILSREKNNITAQESRKLTKKLLLTYGIVYFSFAFTDLLQTTYSLFVFTKNGEFATAGILNATFNCFYAVGFYLAGIVNEKKDTTILVSLCCVLIGICVIILPFIDVTKLFILVCIIYGLIGFSYPFISLFVLDRMLIKSRIMACSNSALFTRETSCVLAYCVGYTFGYLGLMGIFIVTCVTMAASGLIIPYGEEKSRQNLVDYLQNNEIQNRGRRSIAKQNN